MRFLCFFPIHLLSSLFNLNQLQPQVGTVMSSKKYLLSKSNELIKDVFQSRLKTMFSEYVFPGSDGWVLVISRTKITRCENVDRIT